MCLYPYLLVQHLSAYLSIYLSSNKMILPMLFYKPLLSKNNGPWISFYSVQAHLSYPFQCLPGIFNMVVERYILGNIGKHSWWKNSDFDIVSQGKAELGAGALGWWGPRWEFWEWRVGLSQAGNTVTLGFPAAWCGLWRNILPAALQVFLFTVSPRTM